MFGIDFEARENLAEQRAHFAAVLAGIIEILLDKGICTKREVDDAVARQRAMVDQRIAAERDARK
jgi:riboflavin biosynthesis pyrimidine reductase